MQVSSKEAIYASKDYVEFHAISCSAHHWVCENNKIKGYPTVRAYKAYSSDYVTLNRFTPESVAASFGLSFDQGRNNENLDIAFEIDAQGDITSHFDILGAARDAYKRTKNELFSDAALSFVYSLKNHILPEDSFKTASNGLDKIQKSAFSEWIDLLYWTLPTTWKLHTLIVDIRQNMDHVTSSRSELIAIVEKHHEVILEKTVHWSESCSKGRDNKMSFICGMWNLLHISSIGTASHHKSVLGDKSRVTTQHVATTVRNFIDFFLQGNDFTRQHFLELYDKCSFNHCRRFRKKKGVQVQDQSYWEQYPLWLWEVHNSINMEHLTLQAIERHSPVTKEEELLVLWPTSGACHDCKNSDGRWNTDGVYQHLMSQYWPSGVHNFRYVVLDKKETESVDENESIFSTKNILLFSVFIIILARKFRNSRGQCRGRRKKTDSDVV